MATERTRAWHRPAGAADFEAGTLHTTGSAAAAAAARGARGGDGAGTTTNVAGELVWSPDARDDGACVVRASWAEVTEVKRSKKGGKVAAMMLMLSGGSKLVFKFDDEVTRDRVYDEAVREVGARADAGPARAPGAAAPATDATAEELLNRARALRDDTRLKRFHARLVEQDGILTESEFWQTHADAERRASTRAASSSSQRTGLPTALQHALRRRDGGGIAKVSITSEFKRVVFLEEPGLERTFAARVTEIAERMRYNAIEAARRTAEQEGREAPTIDRKGFDRAAEAEFWKCYVEYKAWQRKKKRQGQPLRAEQILEKKRAASAPTDDGWREADFRCFAQMEEEERTRKRAWLADGQGPVAKVQRIDPSIDLQADTFDTKFTDGGHGIAQRSEDPTGADPMVPHSEGLIVQANKHSDTVMTAMMRDGDKNETMGNGTKASGLGGADGAAIDEESVQRAAALVQGQMEAMEDLVGERPEEYELLSLARPCRGSRVLYGDEYPHARSVAADSAAQPCEADFAEHKAFLRWLRGEARDGERARRIVITRGLSCGKELLSDLAHRISSAQSHQRTLAALDTGDGALPKDVLGELMQLAAYAHELLRHYWSAIQRYIETNPDLDTRPAHESLGRGFRHMPGREDNNNWKKALRVQGKLGEVSDALQGGLRGLPPTQRQRAGELVTSLVRSIEKSSDHFIDLSE